MKPIDLDKKIWTIEELKQLSREELLKLRQYYLYYISHYSYVCSLGK